MNIFTTAFFFSIFRIATPILFATLAAVIGEKGGVSNIGLEGIMMMSALFGSLTAYWTGQWWIGVLAAMVVGCAEALLMGFFAFKLKTDIILTGTAVNMIGRTVLCFHNGSDHQDPSDSQPEHSADQRHTCDRKSDLRAFDPHLSRVHSGVADSSSAV